MLRFVSRKCHFVYNQRSPRPVWKQRVVEIPPLFIQERVFAKSILVLAGKQQIDRTAKLTFDSPSCTQLSACSTRPPLFHRLIGSAVAYSKVSGPRSLKAFHDHGFSIVARPRMGHTYFVVKVRMCEMMERQDLRFFVNNS